MKLLKKWLILFLLLSLFIFISAFSYVNAVSNHISDSVFRLHILANSNSVEDQALKYKVRDAVIEKMHSLSPLCSTKEEVIQLARENLDEIKKIAQETINSNGYLYPVSVSIGNYSFPTKEYGDISLPAGYYDAIKIEIGSATGQNWWCVMFPPLCFVDVSTGVVPDESKEMIHSKLSDEEFEIISEENNKVNFKFKLIELLSNMSHFLTASK